MSQKLPLNGIIISIIDERGPHPKIWYPNFATLQQIHNSAVKSFSILVGDRSYREKSPRDLTCFSILPFPDINSIGFIHFSVFNEINEKKSSSRELPITITLLFDETYRDELCQKGPMLYQFLVRESESLWGSLQHHESNAHPLSKLYEKIINFLNQI
ncbi:MAG: hypothetical protein ACTSYB_10325 [Candidatus Helarchaeota archaeon]